VAITVPSDLELMDVGALLGHVPADDKDPLYTLLRRANWLYATHAPPLLNVCVHEPARASIEILAAVVPSADSLTYSFDMSLRNSATDTVQVDVEESSTSSGAGFAAVSGSPFTTASLTAGDNWIATLDVPLAAATRWIKITVAPASGTVVVHSVVIRPKRLTTLSSGALSSGVVLFDDSHLTDADAAIHTEYINRAALNYHLTVKDRYQCIAGFANHSTPHMRWVPGTGGANVDAHFLIFGVVPLPPGAEETTVTVRLRADDSGAGGTVLVGQLNGSSVELDADNADNTATLVLVGDRPVVFAQVIPDTALDVYYLNIDWQPDDVGSAVALITEPAPPARLDYLLTLDAVGLEACLRPYAMPLVSFDWNDTSGTYWHWAQVIPPGTRRGRAIFTRSRDFDESVEAEDAEAWAATTTNPATAAEAVNVPCSTNGAAQYDPMTAPTVDWGSMNDEDTPVGAMDRMFELTEDREPYLEKFQGRYCVGSTLIPQPVADIRDV